MAGDVNLFLNDPDDRSTGEVEVRPRPARWCLKQAASSFADTALRLLCRSWSRSRAAEGAAWGVKPWRCFWPFACTRWWVSTLRCLFRLPAERLTLPCICAVSAGSISMSCVPATAGSGALSRQNWRDQHRVAAPLHSPGVLGSLPQRHLQGTPRGSACHAACACSLDSPDVSTLEAKA